MIIEGEIDGLSENPNVSFLKLPEDVCKNLATGEQLTVSNRPFFYHEAFLEQVLNHVIENRQGPFSSEAFRENARQFLQTFKLVKRPIVYPPKPSRLFWGYYDPSFMRVEEIPPPDFKKQRVFVHGRFNGVPHPGYLETLTLLRDMNRKAEIWLGIDSDVLTINMGQVPFMDPMFRASFFRKTNLVDKFIFLESPASNTERDSYWDGIYAIDLEGLNPDVIFMLEDEKFETKFAQTSVRSAIITEHDLGNELLMHQTDLKEGRISSEEVKRRWDKLRELLQKTNLP